MQVLRDLCRHDPEALSLLEQALANGPGGANNPEGRNQYSKENGEVNHDNVMVDQPANSTTRHGNSTEYAIRRLSRERPDLLGKVEAGELSPHRAMVEAGFRGPREGG